MQPNLLLKNSIAIILIIITGSVANANDFHQDENNTIAALILKTLKDEYSIKITGQIDSEFNISRKDFAGKIMEAQDYGKEVLDSYERLLSHDLRYTDVSVEILEFDIKPINNNTISCYVLEHTTSNMVSISFPDKKLPVTEERINHEFILEKTDDNQWHIIKDIQPDRYRCADPESFGSEEERQEVLEAFPDFLTPVHEMFDTLETDSVDFSSDTTDFDPPIISGSAYHGAAAARYALKYTYSYNDNYRKW